MSAATALLVDHGYAVLFAYVSLSLLGMPLPCSPLIVAAGALAAAGRMRAGTTVVVVVLASLCADTIWYHLGRARGAAVLRALCRISLEPDLCVRRTKDAFGRYGARFLLVAKFVPGLGLMAAPVAGQTRIPYRRFLVYETAGAAAWGGAYTELGLLMGHGLERNAPLLRATARYGAMAILFAVAGLVALRLIRRRRFRRRTAVSRITPEELKGRMERGEPVYIIDVRRVHDAAKHENSLPDAIPLTPEEVLSRTDRLPRDRDIVLFCDCPGEASAALVASALQRSGFGRARPLQGGLEAWIRAGYAVHAATAPPDP